MVLKETRGPYIFAATKSFVNSFVRTKFNVDIYKARSSAISAFFWKLLVSNKEPLYNEKKIESVMKQLSIYVDM